jgi:hypothetical protein
VIASRAVVEQAPIHWEAVLITAVPSFFAMIAALGAAIIGVKNHGKIGSIDHAVNGTLPGEATLREETQAVNHAVNGADDGAPSIKEDVATLVGRRDLDPRVSAPEGGRPDVLPGDRGVPGGER